MTPGLHLFALHLLAVVALVGVASIAEAATRSDVKRIVVEESLRAGFPPSLAMAVAEVESDFRDDLLGKAGARGVMQILPSTAEALYGVDPDELWEARLNVRIGIDYLQSLIRRHGGNWELALSRFGADPRVEPSEPAAGAYASAVLRLQRRYRNQARLWAAELKAGTGELASIQAPYSRSGDMGYLPASTAAATVAKPGLDDFEMAIEVRRRAARLRLDDFAPLVRRPGE